MDLPEITICFCNLLLSLMLIYAVRRGSKQFEELLWARYKWRRATGWCCRMAQTIRLLRMTIEIERMEKNKLMKENAQLWLAIKRANNATSV